jgi:hypothetical protein
MKPNTDLDALALQSRNAGIDSPKTGWYNHACTLLTRDIRPPLAA